MSAYPAYNSGPVPVAPRPKYTSVVAVIGGLVLGAALTFLLFPVFISPFLAVGWIYLVRRAYTRKDVLNGLFTAPHVKEIAFRATGIAIANPLATLTTIPLAFFAGESGYRLFAFIVWAVLAIAAERFALSLIKKHGA